MSKLDPAVKLYRATKRQRAAATRPVHAKLMRQAKREFERQIAAYSNPRRSLRVKGGAS